MSDNPCTYQIVKENPPDGFTVPVSEDAFHRNIERILDAVNEAVDDPNASYPREIYFTLAAAKDQLKLFRTLIGQLGATNTHEMSLFEAGLMMGVALAPKIEKE